ncbi:MAG: amino acid racemase [Bacteroidota bacterium]
MIGIVGGVGPYAGLDLAKNVFDNTLANTDQDHLPVIMISHSETILDRTEYLLGYVKDNPGVAIANVLLRLEKAGATVAGIPCNTAHAHEIFSETIRVLEENNSPLELLSLAKETIQTIINDYPQFKNIGVLSTTGTYKFGIYSDPLKEAGLNPVIPLFDYQEKVVHPSIYDQEYGIKAKSNPVTARARQDLLDSIELLKEKGAELIIKGCTEIALAVPEMEISGVPLIDPSIALARSLIRHYDSTKLKTHLIVKS